MKRTALVCSLVLTALFASGTLAMAAEFSADMVTRDQGSVPLASGPSICYVKGVKMRQEWRSAGRTLYVIIRRPDKGVSWLLAPEIRICQESPIPRSSKPAPVIDELRRQIPSLRRAGSEMIKGYRCDKYEGAQTQGSVSTAITVWVSTKLNTVLRVESRTQGGIRMTEAGRISEKPQPDSLFEIPAGYKKLKTDAATGGRAVPGR